ncbi:MAG: hypothetical protein GY749_43605 [Desulfobacteraceae bacterium]|nr:hypothetical protein [Desulfobacteraceae bacterium]
MKPKPNVFPLKKQKARSISRELTGGLIFTVLIVSTIAISAGYFRASRNAGALLENKAEQYITSLTNILPVPLWNYDRETVRGIAAFYAQNEFVSKLEITDSEGNIPDDKMEFELNQCWAIRRGNIHLVMDLVCRSVLPMLPCIVQKLKVGTG